MDADAQATVETTADRWLLTAGACAWILLLGTAVAVPGQVAERVLEGGADCPQCGIDLRPVLTLGNPEGPGMLETILNTVRMDSHGRYYVASSDVPAFWVFGEDGEVIQRVGRRGEGPGEFQRTSAILVGPGDSVYVFDPLLGRMSVFSPSHELARTAQLQFIPGLFDGAATDQGIILNADIRTPDQAGYPLHLLDYSGVIIRSFGSETGILRPDIVHSSRRAVTKAAVGGVWTAWLNQYVVEHWSSTGTLRQRFRRQVDWFEPYDTGARPPAEPPSPYVRALFEHEGTLWVLVTVAGEDWHAGIDSIIPDPGGGRDFFTIGDWNRYHNTIVEALDIASGRVLVSARVPRLLFGFAGARMAYSPDVDEAGNPVVVVFELTVTDPTIAPRR